MIKKILLYISLLLVALSSCKKDEQPNLIDPNAYLDKWTGEYEGNSRYWITYPVDTAFTTFEHFNMVEVEVWRGSKDSTLSLSLAFDDSTTSNWFDLKFNTDGQCVVVWPGGSSYAYLHINFRNDSLDYEFFQKCGIPCSSAREFVIPRKP